MTQKGAAGGWAGALRAEAAGQRSACGQPVTHPAMQLTATEGIVPLPGAQHHHAVLTQARVVGLPRLPVAGAEGFRSEDEEGGSPGPSPPHHWIPTTAPSSLLTPPSLP